MTKRERKEQIARRSFVVGLVIADIIGIALFIGGCERVMAEDRAVSPVGGFAAHMNEIALDTEETEEGLVIEEMCCETEETLDYMLVDATAYYDAYGFGCGSGGRPLVEGLSVAGRVEWLDKDVDIYAVGYEDSVGELIGHYRFTDTGYGQASGIGESKILRGRTLGTIEIGQCIDIFFSSRQKCAEWGRRRVFIVIK